MGEELRVYTPAARLVSVENKAGSDNADLNGCQQANPLTSFPIEVADYPTHRRKSVICREPSGATDAPSNLGHPIQGSGWNRTNEERRFLHTGRSDFKEQVLPRTETKPGYQ